MSGEGQGAGKRPAPCFFVFVFVTLAAMPICGCGAFPGKKQPRGSPLFSQGSFGSQKPLPRMCGNVEHYLRRQGRCPALAYGGLSEDRVHFLYYTVCIVCGFGLTLRQGHTM